MQVLNPKPYEGPQGFNRFGNAFAVVFRTSQRASGEELRTV